MIRQKVKEFIGFERRIISQLEHAQTKDGSIKAFATAMGDALTTAETIYLFKTSNIKSKIDIEKAMEWLCKIQSPEGKWTTGSPDAWETSTTAWAILALSKEYSKYKDNITRAISWLISKQDIDGGFSQSDFITEPNTYATAYSGLACHSLGETFKNNENKALEWLKKAQNNDGGFGLHIGENSEASLTAYVCHFLVSLKNKRALNIYKKATNWLIRNQRPSGAWTSWFEKSDSIEGTCFTLFVLCLGGLHLTEEDVFTKGLKFLIKKLNAEEVDNWICVSLLHLMNALRIRFSDIL